jgi:hypothetical protein
MAVYTAALSANVRKSKIILIDLVQEGRWGCSMRYLVASAAKLAILLFVPLAAYGQDTALSPQLSACKPPRGAVLVSPQTPHTTVKVFCVEELKRLDCQILSHLRNYILYSYGRCENEDDMYKQNFSRPSCSQLKDKELADFNIKVNQAIPDEVWSFVRTIRRTEADKGCLRNNLVVDY